MIDLLGIGTPVMDIYYQVHSSSLKKYGLKRGCTNHLNDQKVTQIQKDLEPIYEYPGDNARNVCEAFVKSDGKNCAYSGNIAEDETGKKISANLQKNAIKDYMQKIDGNTGRIICLIDEDKQRTFAVYLGVGEKHLELSAIDFPKILFCTNITFFHSSAGKDALEFAIKCKKLGTKIAVSLESENLIKEKLEDINKLSQIIDYLFLNEDEMRAINKNEQDVGEFAPIVFLKRGKNGANVYDNKKLVAHVPANKVDKVVDTTGAGDFFAGACLNAILNGKSIVESARAGNDMAGRIISRIGVGI